MAAERMWLALVIGAGVLWASSAASAQEVTGETVLLVTERSEVGVGGGQASFWWRAPAEPAWTETDRALMSRLEGLGVEVWVPGAATSVSKIYRRPGLSVANAATLADLLGGARVVVGTVAYAAQDPVPGLGMAQVEALAEVAIAKPGQGSRGREVERFEVRRRGYGETPRDALESARDELVEGFAEAIRARLAVQPGRVGWDAGEPLIGLREVADARVLEGVTDFLRGLDEVGEVHVRWAGQGLIALELNPGVKDEQDTIEYAIRALSRHEFEGYRLSQQPGAVAENLVEFWVDRPVGEGRRE